MAEADILKIVGNQGRELAVQGAWLEDQSADADIPALAICIRFGNDRDSSRP